MGYNCCVPQCNSKWKRGESNKIMFHRFPKSKSLAEQWRVKIRSGKKPTPQSKVCSLHFNDDDYKVTSLGQWKILLSTAVPSMKIPVRSHDRNHPRPSRARAPRNRTTQVDEDWRNEDPRPTVTDDIDINETAAELLTVDDSCNEIAEEVVVETSADNVVHTASSNSPNHGDAKVIDVGCQTFLQMHLRRFVTFVLLNDAEVKYLTSFDSQRFETLFEFVYKNSGQVGPTIYNCDIKDQLLLTLCKYRHNQDFKMLAFLFGIPEKSASIIFSFWNKAINKALKSIDMWSLGDQNPNNYKVIIDCTEIPVECSENPAYHQLTYSQYKNRPTFKCLVGIDESGVVTFCSELYGGSTSDRQIVILSKLIDLLQEGDTVLADRGFEISDLLEKKKVALNIPPFLRGKKQLTEKEVMETRKLANRRIHVERLIGLSKVNAILNEPMPSCFWPQADEIVYNCIMLCNFKERIVKSVLPKTFRKKGYKKKFVNL